MKTGFYPRLAWTGIRKNKRIYLPYLAACIVMVLIFYIICFLSEDQTVQEINGGATMQMMLSLGTGVMGFFALLFLFYTNSFLMKRRKKEFGLYHILGMGKKNVAAVLVWESLLVSLIALTAGLASGILFSKLGELVMVNMLEEVGDFSFSVEPKAVLVTLCLFLAIFFLILLSGVWQVYRSDPIELLHSESAGEKPPKGNWLAALLGIGLLGGAYWIAVTIQEPVSAMIWFFVAVAMVIGATYLLFCSGSVVLCRILQAKKTYYYKTSHFISVSSMRYRMKRNGAGLASICILSTMVLVMMSATSCLFLGSEESMRARYPRDVVLDTYSEEEQKIQQVHQTVDTVLKNYGEEKENDLSYRILDLTGLFAEDQVILDPEEYRKFTYSGYDDVRQIMMIPVEDYNDIMGEEEVLEPDEVLVYNTKSEFRYDYEQLNLQGLGTWKIKKQVKAFVNNGVDSMQIIPTTYLFVSDFGVLEQIYEQFPYRDESFEPKFHDYYGFDLTCEEESQAEIAQTIYDSITDLQIGDSSFPTVEVESAAKERMDFYAMYAGMFLLGIILGVVFLMGTVLIMYYKQVTEGYEDQGRFAILLRVGMTKEQIKKSIRSQVLTVFFLPLAAAGIHTGFAFPIMHKILLLFGLTNLKLLLAIMAGTFLLFAAFYVIMYLVTSGAYYRIVSKGKEEA